jgi:plastocyanin
MNVVLKGRVLVLAAPLLLAALALSGAAAQVATGDDDVQRIRIVAGEHFFKPSRLTVKVNKLVELLVSREAGIVPHNLMIDAAAAGISIKEDLSIEPRKIAFTPTAAGVYPFYCDKKLLFFASHREKGMEGILEVCSLAEPPAQQRLIDDLDLTRTRT